MRGAGGGGRVDDGVKFGWSGYARFRGSKRLELNILNNLGQVFYLGGDRTAAVNAFAAVLSSNPTVEVAAVALGGYALACADISDPRGVQWAASEATSLSEVVGHRYEIASSLLECASALDAIGDAPYASVLRARGSTIAQYGGFFELLHNANLESRVVLPPLRRVGLNEHSVDIARQISDLRPAGVPDRLQLVGV